jgi:hypothetical protein
VPPGGGRDLFHQVLALEARVPSGGPDEEIVIAKSETAIAGRSRRPVRR